MSLDVKARCVGNDLRFTTDWRRVNVNYFNKIIRTNESKNVFKTSRLLIYKFVQFTF